MEAHYVADTRPLSHQGRGSVASQQPEIVSMSAYGTPSPPPGDSSLLLSHLEVPDQVRGLLTEGLGSSPNSYDTYLRSVDRLRESVQFLEQVLRSGQELLTSSLDALEQRFDSLLRESSIAPDPEELKAAMLSDSAPDHIRPPEVVAGGAIDQLHAVARRLVNCDRAGTCTRLYKTSRGIALQQNFEAMHVLQLTERQVHDMAWPELERNMQKWNEHMHIGMIFIAAEREACDLILDDLEPFREECFVELSRPCMLLLTNFGLAVAGTRQSPEKLFALLDMYETALDLHQTVDELFAGREGASVRSEYARLLLRLGAAARETFEKFEDAVKEQPTGEEAEEAPPPVLSSPSSSSRRPKLTPHKLNTLKGGKSFFGKLRKGKGIQRPDDDAMTDVGSVASTAAGAACASGKVHPLTSYVINYVIILCNGELPYFGNLEHAVGEALGLNGSGEGSTSDRDSVSTASAAASVRGQTRVQFRVAFATKRILEALKKKLEDMAAAVGDDVLGELFLLNNVAYILNKIETSDAGRLLGVAWCGECEVEVDKHRDSYVRNALAKFDPAFVEGPLDTPSLQKRLRQFNTAYAKLRERQLSWTIPQEALREQVKTAVSKGLMERYSAFLVRAGPILQQQQRMDVNIMSCKQVSEGLDSSFPAPARPANRP